MGNTNYRRIGICDKIFSLGLTLSSKQKILLAARMEKGLESEKNQNRLNP